MFLLFRNQKSHFIVADEKIDAHGEKTRIYCFFTLSCIEFMFSLDPQLMGRIIQVQCMLSDQFLNPPKRSSHTIHGKVNINIIRIMGIDNPMLKNLRPNLLHQQLQTLIHNAISHKTVVSVDQIISILKLHTFLNLEDISILVRLSNIVR